MSKSPLSGAFSGSSEPAKKKNKKNGAILLIAGVALASSIGGVFAANSSIDLNGGEAIEFGQGIAVVDTCAASAEVSMGQIFDPEGDSDTGEFYVGAVTVTFAAGCDGKNATVSLLEDDGSSAATFTGAVASNVLSETYDATDAIVADTVVDVTVTTAD